MSGSTKKSVDYGALERISVEVVAAPAGEAEGTQPRDAMPAPGAVQTIPNVLIELVRKDAIELRQKLVRDYTVGAESMPFFGKQLERVAEFVLSAPDASPLLKEVTSAMTLVAASTWFWSVSETEVVLRSPVFAYMTAEDKDEVWKALLVNCFAKWYFLPAGEGLQPSEADPGGVCAVSRHGRVVARALALQFVEQLYATEMFSAFSVRESVILLSVGHFCSCFMRAPDPALLLSSTCPLLAHFEPHLNGTVSACCGLSSSSAAAAATAAAAVAATTPSGGPSSPTGSSATASPLDSAGTAASGVASTPAFGACTANVSVQQREIQVRTFLGFWQLCKKEISTLMRAKWLPALLSGVPVGSLDKSFAEALKSTVASMNTSSNSGSQVPLDDPRLNAPFAAVVESVIEHQQQQSGDGTMSQQELGVMRRGIGERMLRAATAVRLMNGTVERVCLQGERPVIPDLNDHLVACEMYTFLMCVICFVGRPAARGLVETVPAMRAFLATGMCGASFVVLAYLHVAHGVTTVLGSDVRETLWDMAAQRVQPRYMVSAQEGALPLQENWRPAMLVRFHPARPQGLSRRDYVVSRVLSWLVRERGTDKRVQWEPWERAFWDIVAPHMLKIADLSDSASTAVLHTALRFLAREGCAAVTHLNVQNADITAHEIALFPERLRAVALSDTTVDDCDVAELVRQCPLLEVVVLRDCEAVTDAALMALRRLRALRFLDISGDVGTTREGRAAVREAPGLTLKFEQYTATLNDKMLGDFRGVAESFMHALDARLALLETEGFSVDLITSADYLRGALGQKLFDSLSEQATQSIAPLTSVDSVRARFVKDTLRQALAVMDPLSLLLVQYCGSILPLSGHDMSRIWCRVYASLFPGPSPLQTSQQQQQHVAGTDYRRLALERYLAVNLFGDERRVDHLTLRQSLLWFLSDPFVQELDLRNCLLAHTVDVVLQKLARHHVRLSVLHVRTDAAAVEHHAAVPPAVVKRLVVHGQPLPAAVAADLVEVYARAGTEVVFEYDTETLSEALARDSSSTSSGEETGSGGSNNRCMGVQQHFAAIANDFVCSMEGVMRDHAAQIIDDVPAEPLTKLFLCVKAFTEAVDAFAAARGVAGQLARAQLLCDCAALLPVSALVLLEYTGVLLRLADDQRAHLWRRHARALGVADARLARIAARELALGEYVSRLLLADNMDTTATLVLQLCQTLHYLRVSASMMPFPYVPASLQHLTIVGLGTVALPPELRTLPDRLAHPRAVVYLSLHHVADLHEDDLRLLTDAFTSLRTLAVDHCPRITPAAIAAFRAQHPAIDVKYVQ